MTQRFSLIDQTRGLLLVLMTVDHAASFIHRSHPVEIWGPNLPDYHGATIDLFARLITHLCAPGFFFLMGVSMALLAGKVVSTDRWHFVKRGLVLIVLQIFVENFAWFFGHSSATIPRESYGYLGGPGLPGPTWMYWGVLYALGGAMLIGALLLRSNAFLIMIAALIAQLVPAYLVMTTNPAEPINFATALITLPAQAGVNSVRYSLFPWVSLTLLGLLYGRALSEKQSPLGYEGIAALVLLIAFVSLRFMGIGDYHPKGDNSIIGFFNLTKYPPSLIYQLFSIGIVLAFLATFSGQFALKPLKIYGQATLFFYIAHLYLLAAISWLFRDGAGWPVVAACDIAVLIALYFLCAVWAKHKRKYPASHWLHLL